MNAFKAIRILSVILIIYSLLNNTLYANDTDKINASDLQELCQIYKKTINKQTDLVTKESFLVENIQNKLPVLYNNLYQYVTLVDSNKRYNLIQQYAKQQSKITWRCEVARLYYVNGF